MNGLHWLAAMLCAVTGAVGAQAGRTEPLYRSAFDGYRSLRADEPVDWKRANDEMKGLGGHAGHLRGAPPAAGKPAERAAQESRQPPMDGGHRMPHGARQ